MMTTQRTSIPPNDLASLSRWSSQTTLVSLATNRRSTKSTASKLKEEDESYTEKPPSSTAHGSHPLKQTQRSHAIRLLKACQPTLIRGTSSRVPEGKGVTTGAVDGRPLTRLKTKFLAVIACVCGRDVINEDELPSATTPVEGDPNISDPWNFQHNVHLEPSCASHPSKLIVASLILPI
ncbi:hypothetical protein BDN71DRAFT_522097 [Pleurotus eryngii]|uniref:CRIB domain-containing protein n=1 Tax=Pleurotus eryngii TaxID=5323 RepID=A0A9P6D0Z5_PLEER|nr:hypothetical protein BDN71DRAFT_522097 [Pleurotus eryngii]